MLKKKKDNILFAGETYSDVIVCYVDEHTHTLIYMTSCYLIFMLSFCLVQYMDQLKQLHSNNSHMILFWLNIAVEMVKWSNIIWVKRHEGGRSRYLFYQS